MMPFFNCKLAVANVDVRADDCAAEFITGGVCNRKEKGRALSNGGALEGDKSWRMPEGGVMELWVVQELEGELVKVNGKTIPRTAGRLRTTKSLAPHTISRVSSMKASRAGEGALRKRMSRLPRGVQKAARSLLPEKRGEDSSLMRVQTALTSASRRECQ